MASAIPRPVGRRDFIALLGLTVVLRLPALLAGRHLVFDDGVYGASALAMRDGAAPFKAVFSSQGPLFLPLVWLADLAGLRTLNAPRVLSLASGAVLVTAVWWAARLLDLSRGSATAAAVLVATSGSVLWVTGPITSDAPAMALAAVAVTLALAYRRSPSLKLALLTGLAMGACLSVKSLLVPAAVPVGLALLGSASGVGRRHLAAAVGAASALALALALPWGLADVWDQSIQYHLDVAGSRTPGANAAKLLSTLGDRDLPVLLATIATVLVAVGVTKYRPPLRPWPMTGLGLVWMWLAATIVVLLTEHPLWRSHVAHPVPALALLAAANLPRLDRRALRIGMLAGVAVLPYHLGHNSTILWPDPAKGAEAAARADLATLPAGAWALSDEPGLVWREGRRTTADLVDTSMLRVETGRMTAASVAAEAVDPHVCAVIVWSNRFGDFSNLPALLASQGYEEQARYGGPRVLYVRPACQRPAR